MSNTHILAAREIDGKLNDSINVGVRIVGMPLGFASMTDTDVEEWTEWHDRWEETDKGTQDSYLVLLALKGDNGFLHDQ